MSEGVFFFYRSLYSPCTERMCLPVGGTWIYILPCELFSPWGSLLCQLGQNIKCFLFFFVFSAFWDGYDVRIPDCLSLELTFGTLTEGPYCYSLLTFKMYLFTSLSKCFSLYTDAIL